MSYRIRHAFDVDGAFYREKIANLLDEPQLSQRIRDYISPSGPYAADSFDSVGSNPRDSFGVADFLAMGFLDTPIRASSFREFERRASEFGGLLHAAPDDTDLWDMTPNVYAAANRLWDAIRSVKGMGITRTSKLMARKRPRLIPILDSRVRNFFEERTDNFWWPLAISLGDESLQKSLNDVRERASVSPAISTLRLLDIAIWMHQRDAPGTVEVDKPVTEHDPR